MSTPLGQAARTVRVFGCDVTGHRGDLGAVSQLIRQAEPDVAVVTGAPWRWRARTHTADLADRGGLYAAAGSMASVGNLILVSLRIRVHDTWCVQFPLVPGRRMQGAVLARLSLGDNAFVVAGTRLSTEDAERATQAEILARLLSEVDDPGVLAGDVAETVLTRGRVEAVAAGSPGGAASPVIMVGPAITVRARHYARRGRATSPIMADLLLPADATGRTAP